jgi:uncharacterized protein (DUF4415 family)
MRREYSFKDAKRGPVIPPKGKTRITIYIDTDVLEKFRERAEKVGYSYQTMINEALRQYLAKERRPLEERPLRRVPREGLQGVPLTTG